MSTEKTSTKTNTRRFLARVSVMPRRAVLDPQGKAIEQALARLGHQGLVEVRGGKLFELTLEARDAEAARASAAEMAEELLANPVMEDWSVTVADAEESGPTS